MAPLAQPHPQDTCGIGSGPFFVMGWPEGRFGIDWVEMKWSPLNRLHLNPFLSSHPPKLSLSLVYSSSNCQHSACRWPHIAITLRCPIVLVAIALSSSHRYCCRQRRQCQHCHRRCCCRRCCSPLHCRCCHHRCHPCCWHCCRCWRRRCQHRCLVPQGSGLTRLRSSHPCQVAYLVSLYAAWAAFVFLLLLLFYS